MNTILLILKFLVSDMFVFSIFEIAFLGLFLCAVLFEWSNKRGGSHVSVKRGEEILNVYPVIFGILSVLIVQVINSAEMLVGYKTLISILNLSILVYLAYFNGWFRKKTHKYIVESMKVEEIYRIHPSK